MGYQKQTLPFDSLGGVRTDLPLSKMEPHHAVIAKNARQDRSMRARTRTGPAKYNTTQMGGTTSILGLYHFKYGASGSKFIECWDQYIYTDDGTTRTQIGSGQNTAAYYWFETFDDFCWISNGVNTFLKYDGTTRTLASLAVPAVGTFAATPNAAGVLTGSYYYLVTFYVPATGQESNPFTLASAPNANPAAQQVDLTNIPVSADSQVGARRIYRTTNGGSVYDAQLVTTINDNSTTTYTDNTADTALGALVPLDHDPAPVLQKMVVHRNRGFGFCANSSRLYFTLPYQLWYWPQGITDLSLTAKLYYIDINPDDGDKISNIVSYDTGLLIFKTNAVYLLSGDDETDFTIDPMQLSNRVGCASFRAATVAGNVCYFLDTTGIYGTNGQSIEYIGKPVEGFFDPNNAVTTEKVNKTYLTNACAIVENVAPNYLVRFDVPTGSSAVNNFHIFCNYETGEWVWDTGYQVQSAAILENNGQDYVIVGDDYGWVWTFYSQDGDGGLVYSTATSGGASTLTDTTQTWTVNIYDGVYVEILSGTGEGQRRRISSNTANQLTVDTAWDTNPDSSSVYTVGGIDFDYQGSWNNYGSSAHTKRLLYIRPRYETTGNYSATVYPLYDFQSVLGEGLTSSVVAVSWWDVALWDVGTFDGQSVSMNKVRVPSGYIHRWNSMRWNHKPAAQPIILNGYDKVFQARVMR